MIGILSALLHLTRHCALCNMSSTSASIETPLISGSDNVGNDVARPADSPNAGNHISEVPPGIARRLYISHFLSTWNSRVFEFGAVLYLATIFPNTLLPMSVYALARGASAIVFSPTVGRYIDTHNRLQVVRLSIGTFLIPQAQIHLSVSDRITSSLSATSCSSFLCCVLASSDGVGNQAFS